MKKTMLYGLAGVAAVALGAALVVVGTMIRPTVPLLQPAEPPWPPEEWYKEFMVSAGRYCDDTEFTAWHTDIKPGGRAYGRNPANLREVPGCQQPHARSSTDRGP